MNCISILVLWILFIATTSVQAQFTYNSRQGKTIIQRPSSQTQTTDKETRTSYQYYERNTQSIRIRGVLSQIDQLSTSASKDTFNELDTLLKYTTPIYLRLKRRKLRLEDREKTFLIRDSTKRVLYRLHEYYLQEKTIVWQPYLESNFRSSKSLATQGLAGLQGIANDFSLDGAGALLELGGRISNMRLTLPTKTEFSSRESASEDTLYLITLQKDKYLYLDFISRGVLATDSLQATISEYVNTTMGSPLSFRANWQWSLSRPYHIPVITKKREPNFYFNLGLDARAIPVLGTSSLEQLGGSVHIMPSFWSCCHQGLLIPKLRKTTSCFNSPLTWHWYPIMSKKSCYWIIHPFPLCVILLFH